MAEVKHRRMTWGYINTLEAELASAQSGKASLAKIMDRIHDALGLTGQSYQPHQLPGKVTKLMERLRLAEGNKP